MLPERFFLGVGSGESLKEHVLGSHWPTPDVRQDMLEEAIEVMRMCRRQGGAHSHDGVYFQVEDAQVFTPARAARADSGRRQRTARGRGCPVASR